MFYKGSAISGSGGGSGDAVWGSITGTLSDQTDLAAALAEKQNVIDADNKLSYNYLSDTPTIPTVPQNDNTTISLDASDKLQAIGFKEARTDTAMRVWHGSQQDWEQGEVFYWYNWIDSGWTEESYTPGSSVQHIYAVNYINNKFIAIGYPGDLYISTDGSNWTTDTNIQIYPFFLDMTYGDSKYVAVGSNRGYVSTSTDGSTWTTPQSITNSYLYAICYGTYYDTPVFVTVGRNGIYYSNDGEYWQQVVNSYSSIWGVTYGNGTFVAVGDDGVIMSSTDGGSWTSETSGVSVRLVGIGYGNGKFIAVGFDGTILSSPNGSTWTKETSGTTAKLRSVAYGNGTFIAVGYDGAVLTSSDGSNWAYGNIAGSVYQDIAFGNGKFVLVGYDGGIFSSTDGVSLFCYTLEDEPTTASTVYSAPDVQSALTITSVDSNSITLSDTNTYMRNNYSTDVPDYINMGTAHPDYLCNIDGVGIKIGTTEIANLASYSAFTGATGSVAGSAGLVPAPTTSDVDKYLKGDGTWSTVSGGATGSFTSQDGKTVTVTNGVITSIV